jgi:hypothetical protein
VPATANAEAARNRRRVNRGRREVAIGSGVAMRSILASAIGFRQPLGSVLCARPVSASFGSQESDSRANRTALGWVINGESLREESRSAGW